MNKLFFATSLGSLLVATSANAQTRRTARVHVASASPDVVLEARDDGRWTEVCRGACDGDLLVDMYYRVNGRNIQPSRRFLLQANDDHVWVDVKKTGSSTVHSFGLAMLISGAIAAPIALAVMVDSALAYSCSSCVAGFADTTGLNVGWTMLAIGSVAVVVGAILVTSSRTQIDLGGVSDETLSFVRTPDFERRVLGGPPVIGLPIYSFSF